jgi:hypothetical protein
MAYLLLLKLEFLSGQFDEIAGQYCGSKSVTAIHKSLQQNN